MHEMDCKNCKHSEVMKAGSYQMAPGVTVNLGSDTYRCKLPKIDVIDASGKKDLCSGFEEREPE